MARLLLAEGEDLLARFRPHPASYLPRYGADLLWLAYGLAATWVQRAGDGAELLGLGLLATFALAHAVAARLLRRPGFALGLFALAAALGTLAAQAAGRLPPAPDARLAPAIVGAALTVVALALSELGRRRRVTYATTRRVVLRGGLGRLTERTVGLEAVAAVRALQAPLGQAFGFATLELQLATKGRQKAGAAAPAESLEGVPEWDLVKHRVEAAVDEARLPPRERAKRAEERRVRESLRALAGWYAQPPA